MFKFKQIRARVIMPLALLVTALPGIGSVPAFAEFPTGCGLIKGDELWCCKQDSNGDWDCKKQNMALSGNHPSPWRSLATAPRAARCSRVYRSGIKEDCGLKRVLSETV